MIYKSKMLIYSCRKIKGNRYGSCLTNLEDKSTIAKIDLAMWTKNGAATLPQVLKRIKKLYLKRPLTTA